MNCSGASLTSLPKSVPQNTNVLDLRNNTITELCTVFPYMENLTMLNVESNDIEKICIDFVVSTEIASHTGLVINTQDNKLSALPQDITESKPVQWRLSGNPFSCNCDMLWMRDWFNKSIVHTGNKAVIDYQDVICQGDEFAGQQIFTLQADKMGCIPHTLILAKEAIISLACISAVVVIVLCLALAAFKRWNEIRWIIYKKANKFIARGDKIEDIENIVFDAFISYRYSNSYYPILTP